jgi:hypothetical protein
MNIKITDLVLSLLLVVMFFVSFYLFVYKPKQKDIETITNVVTIHDTVYSHKADTIHDTVVKIKRVYIEKEPFKSDIPSTVLFKKE